MAGESLSQTVDVETPELVVLSYTVAGLGSRVYAAIVDLLICVVALLGIAFTFALIGSRLGIGDAGRPGRGEAWTIAIFLIAQFGVIWGYYVLFEGFADGQTPGKRIHRLRVVRDGGYSVGFSASAVRNLMRIVDMQPAITYLVGMSSVIFSRSGKRLGDVVAGTMVVREALVRAPASGRSVRGPRIPSAAGIPATSAKLSDNEFRLLERWYDRGQEVDADRRAQLTQRVAAQLGSAVADDDTPLAARLIRLFETEQAARARGISARAETGAARERYSIVATQSPRWIAFAAKLSEAQSRGLSSLGESGVRDFVAEYRALSSDFARLRTAARGAESDELFYLGRLVSAAHNLIYRDRRSDLMDVVRFFALDIPREVRRSYRPIALAAALLFGPAAIAFTAVVRHPETADTFIPQSMLDRADQGISRAKLGTGYIEDPQLFRPVMATQIAANNVKVTFAAFAFGITLGIGTALLLVLNGVSFGGVLGLYTAKGIGDLILAFVAPHGVLELTAICIAGGGGFLLASAVLLPGNRTRRRALAENSRRAMMLIGGATLLLIAAGALEGLVSPIPYWPLSLKLSVSALTALMLYVYLRSGASSPSPSLTGDLELSPRGSDSPPPSPSASGRHPAPSPLPGASAPAPRSVLGLAPPPPR
jgi:uncharacterized membrane protein SpoIIM required for sporulation